MFRFNSVFTYIFRHAMPFGVGMVSSLKFAYDGQVEGTTITVIFRIMKNQ